jgi:predicted RNA polymerase sigma factor
LNASRTAARTDQAGEPILLLEQNRALWDQLQIRRGMQALGRARDLGGADGFYALQAAIIACHAEASRAEDTDWSRISGIYGQLAALVRSPVIELNRAVAVGMANGPEAGLAIVDRLVEEPALKTYHLRGSARRIGSSGSACRQPARTGSAEAARRGGGARSVVVMIRLRADGRAVVS